MTAHSQTLFLPRSMCVTGETYTFQRELLISQCVALMVGNLHISSSDKRWWWCLYWKYKQEFKL